MPSPRPTWLHTAQPWLVAVWLSGVVVLSLRLLASIAGVAWLRRGRRPLPDAWRERARRIARRLGMSVSDRIFSTDRAAEAVVVGVLRPIVLIPGSWLARLEPRVLEAVLAHELAHVRRLDLWVNLIQRLAETLLFYHPAVWWLSRRLRVEREMCCDEMAVAATGSRLQYVTALELVARLRPARVRPALATGFGGGNMVLLNRIRHVLGRGTSGDGRWWPVGLAALLVPAGLWLAMFAFAPSSPSVARADDDDEKERPPVRREGDRERGDRREGDRERPREVERREGDRERPREVERREGDRERPREGERREGERREGERRERERPEPFGIRNDGGDRPVSQAELIQVIRHLQREIMQLRREMNELRAHAARQGGPRPDVLPRLDRPRPGIGPRIDRPRPDGPPRLDRPRPDRDGDRGARPDRPDRDRPDAARDGDRRRDGDDRPPRRDVDRREKDQDRGSDADRGKDREKEGGEERGDT